MELKKYRLGEIVDFNKETISRQDDLLEIKYLDTSNILDNVIYETPSMKLSEAPSRAQRKVKHLTIIYSTVRPRLKHHGILQMPPENLIVSTGFATLDIKDSYENMIDATYLYLLLTQSSVTEYLGNIADTAVSAYPSINPSDISSLSFIFPDITIQRKIASIWTSYDQKIHLNSVINDNLEAMAKQLYDYWFVQFDFPNDEGKPYKSSGGAMVWNDKLKREIPQGWDSSMLQSICTIKRGASPRPIDDFMDESHKGMPWVKISDATNSNSPFMTTIKEHIILDGVPKSVKVIPNTLIVSNSATPGIPKFIQIEACVHDGWLVLTDYQEIYKYYLYYVIKMIRHNLLHIASGSIFKNLKTDYLKEFICITPSTEILSKYHNLVKPIMQEILLLQRDTEVLTKQRDELLPLLMNGQAVVNSD